MDIISALLDSGEQYARRALLDRREKRLQAFYHLVTPPGEPHSMVPFDPEMDKGAFTRAVKELSRSIGAVAAMFISESWMVTARDGQLPDRPSEDPRRIEVVTIVATDGKTVRSRYLRMVRDKPGGYIALLVKEDALGGVLVSMFIDGIIAPPPPTGDGE